MLRRWLAEQDGLRERTEAEKLAEQYGVEVREVPSRHPDGVEAIGPGWRIMGSLGEVRAELEQRCRTLHDRSTAQAPRRTDPNNAHASATFASEITTYPFAADGPLPGKVPLTPDRAAVRGQRGWPAAWLMLSGGGPGRW